MGTNFGVGLQCPSALEPIKRFLGLTLPVSDPAHGIQNLWVFRCQLHRPLNQSPGFVEPDIAVREGVAERVVSMGMVRAQRDQASQVTFHPIKSAQAFAEHGTVVQELGLVGLGGEACFDDVEGLGGSTVFAQQLGARLDYPGSVARRFRFGA